MTFYSVQIYCDTFVGFQLFSFSLRNQTGLKKKKGSCQLEALIPGGKYAQLLSCSEKIDNTPYLCT